MALFRLLGVYLAFVSVLILPTVVAARLPTQVGLINSKAVEGKQLWVVSPGTRLMAGSGRSELYILGAAEHAPRASTTTAAKVKTALVVKKHQFARKTVRTHKVKVALRHGHRKLRGATIKG